MAVLTMMRGLTLFPLNFFTMAIPVMVKMFLTLWEGKIHRLEAGLASLLPHILITVIRAVKN